MKKLLSAILALALILTAFSALAPSASASGGTISEKEAKELVRRAYDFAYAARNYSRYKPIIEPSSIENGYIKVPFEDGRYRFYYPVVEENLPGGSYEAMEALAKTIYTEEIAPRAYQNSYSMLNSDEIVYCPLFYTDESGKLYADPMTPIGGIEFGNLNPDKENVEITLLSGNSKSASALISMRFYYADGPRPNYRQAVECKFENTSDGWRIADSEFSLLMATEERALDMFRRSNSDKVNPEALKLIEAEAKYTVDIVMAEFYYSIEYYSRYLQYVEKQNEEGKSLVCTDVVKKIALPDGSVKNMRYVPLISSVGYDEYGEILPCFLSDSAYESYMKYAYSDNDFDKIIIEDNVKYTAVEESASIVYDPETAVVEVIESTDKEATARIYCELKKDGENIPIYVECKFEMQPNYMWVVVESDFVDMLISADEFEYTVGEAPSTGDSSFDTIAVCLGGMALIMSMIGLVRRKREIL